MGSGCGWIAMEMMDGIGVLMMCGIMIYLCPISCSCGSRVGGRIVLLFGKLTN